MRQAVVASISRWTGRSGNANCFAVVFHRCCSTNSSADNNWARFAGESGSRRRTRGRGRSTRSSVRFARRYSLLRVVVEIQQQSPRERIIDEIHGKREESEIGRILPLDHLHCPATQPRSVVKVDEIEYCLEWGFADQVPEFGERIVPMRPELMFGREGESCGLPPCLPAKPDGKGDRVQEQPNDAATIEASARPLVISPVVTVARPLCSAITRRCAARSRLLSGTSCRASYLAVAGSLRPECEPPDGCGWCG